MFDTTGTGYCDAVEGFRPTADRLLAALAAGRMERVKVTSCKLIDLPKVTAIYELDITGLA